jgi:hypothetical protein
MREREREESERRGVERERRDRKEISKGLISETI